MHSFSAVFAAGTGAVAPVFADQLGFSASPEKRDNGGKIMETWRHGDMV